jgi:hypothetical protein
VNIVSPRLGGMDGEEAEMNGFATDWLYEQGSPLRWHRRQTGWAWSHYGICLAKLDHNVDLVLGVHLDSFDFA